MDFEQVYQDEDHDGSQASWRTLDALNGDDLIQLSPQRRPTSHWTREGDQRRSRSREVSPGQSTGGVRPDDRAVPSLGPAITGEARTFSPLNPFRRTHEGDVGAEPRNPYVRMGDERDRRDRFHSGRSANGPTGDDVPVRGTTGIRPGIYDGSSSWEDYQAQFEVVAELHGWSPAVMAMCLAASLRGEAQAVLADLNIHARRDYPALVNALSRRFDPAHQTEVFRIQLKNRTRRKEEALPELAQEIRRLTRQAYPGAPSEVQGLMAKDHFMDALDDPEVRLAVYQARPRTLDEALRVSLEMEAFQKVERQRNFSGRKALRAVEGPNQREQTSGANTNKEGESVSSAIAESMKVYQSALGDMQSMLKSLKDEVQALKGKMTQGPGPGQGRRWSKGPAGSDRGPSRTEDGVPICFRCRKPGHFRRDCPEGQKAQPDPEETQNSVPTENSQLSGLGVVPRQ